MSAREFSGLRTAFGAWLSLVGALAACHGAPGAPATTVSPPSGAAVVTHVAPAIPSITPRLIDVDALVRVFDDPARDSWQRPDLVIAAMEVGPGSTVAEIGSGTGYFNPWLARAVGPEGHVVAIDIEPALIVHLRERAIAEDTPQVEVRLADAGDPRLRPGEVDRVLLVDTYSYIEDRVAYFGSLVAAMKSGGRLIVVDFAAGDSPHGPPAADRLDPEVVIDELGRAGWVLQAQPEVLAEQYVLVFEPR